MRCTTAHLTAIALLLCATVALPAEAFADTAILVRGSTLASGGFDPRILLPNGRMLDVARATRALKEIRYFQGDILFRAEASGERLNLSTVTWLSLTDLLADPARFGVLIYDPALKKLTGYDEYVRDQDIENPSLSLVLGKAGTIGVIPDDTFLRPKAFSFPRPAGGDNTPPVVTPPASITVAATEAGGARPSASTALASFLAGGSATDTGDPAPIRLTPQVEGADVTSGTLFPMGLTTVTFRYKDHSNNIGTATSTATVVLGQPRLSGAIASKGANETGYYVDLKLTNTGTGKARNVSISALLFRTLAGTGSVTLKLPSKVPSAVGDLDAGGSTTVRFYLDRPATVTRFSITENGTLQDVAGTGFSFSIAQSVIP